MSDRNTSSKQQIGQALEGALAGAQLDEEGMQRILARKDELDRKLKTLLLRLSLKEGETRIQCEARDLMDHHFLGLPEIEQHFRLPTPEERAALAEIPMWIMEAIRSKHVRDEYVLVADIGMSIKDVREIHEGLLDEALELHEHEYFHYRTASACWRLVRRRPLASRYGVPNTDEAAQARVMAYTIILHFLATGERINEHVHALTSDTYGDSDDGVLVGMFSDRLHFGMAIGPRSFMLNVVRKSP